MTVIDTTAAGAAGGSAPLTLPFTAEEHLESLRDRSRPADEVADVCVHVEEETDNGLVVSGAKRFTGLAEPCMAEYDLDGWTIPGFIDPDDVSLWGER
jgi:hypothetical protein